MKYIDKSIPVSDGTYRRCIDLDIDGELVTLSFEVAHQLTWTLIQYLNGIVRECREQRYAAAYKPQARDHWGITRPIADFPEMGELEEQG